MHPDFGAPGYSGSMGLFLHLLVDQNAEFLHHVLQRTANTLHFRDIHNTRGLYALDILLRLGKCCTDLCAFSSEMFMIITLLF